MINEKRFFKNIGISYLVSNKRIKCELYNKTADFIVKEIDNKGSLCDISKNNKKIDFSSNKKYIHATLIKKDISTFEACSIFADHNGLDYFKDISFCGLKDTNGLTSQSICIHNKKNLKIKKWVFRKFFLTNFEFSNKKLNVCDHSGNNFTIIARGIYPTKRNIIILNNFKTFAKKGLPNFYGSQRFGQNQDNHFFGKLLLKKKYKQFIFDYLAYSNKSSKFINNIKKKFGNWVVCLDILDKFNGTNEQKELVKNLLKYKNILTAIKKTKLSHFFVHSYSSYLFNKALSSFLRKEYKDVRLLKLGKKNNIDKLNFSIYKSVLEKERVSLQDFELCDFDISAHARHSLFYPTNFNFYFINKKLVLTFDLGVGQYASLLLTFLFKSKRKLD